MSPRRFLNGVSSVTSDHPIGALPYLDPTTWCVWMEDFLYYDPAQGDAVWVIDEVNSPTGDSVIGPTGILKLVNAADASDSIMVQLANGPFQLTSTKRAIMQTRFKIKKGNTGTIGQQGFVIGLSEVVATSNFMNGPPPTALAAADIWGFLSYDNTTDVIAIQGETDVYSTEVGCTTYADDTWYVYAITWDGTTSTFYKDDAVLCTISTNPPTSVISPVFYLGNGEAYAAELHVDYMLVAIER